MKSLQQISSPRFFVNYFINIQNKQNIEKITPNDYNQIRILFLINSNLFEIQITINVYYSRY